MSTEHIVTLLILERDKLNRAIEALGAPAKAIGRPVKTASNDTTGPDSSPKRRTFTAAQRKKQGERMRAFWAAKQKAAGKTAKSDANPVTSAPVKRKPMTAAQKKALSIKMKAAWAKRKKAAKSS
jgi:hypothetical protein